MRLMWNLGLLLVTFFWSGTKACTRDELKMVQIISLHGSLSPPFVYPEDPNPASVWTEGLNDLTMLGKFQAYAMGVFLRNFYGDFITSDPRELQVLSSADKFAVKSAQSLVTALYTPIPYWEVVANFSWQPIYIKYDSDEGKFLSDKMCPAADAEFKSILFSETSARLPVYENLLYYLGVYSGMDVKSLADVEHLFQILQTESSYNLTIPDWSKNFWEEMKYLHDISMSLRAKSRRLQRLRGGPLVGHTMKTMSEKILNEKDPRKVVVYSTHTIPMMNFLAAMGLGQLESPPPCATILVELYHQGNDHLVRYLYLNSTTPQSTMPQQVYSLTVPGCTEYCPLSYVIDYTRDVIPRKWEQECLLI